MKSWALCLLVLGAALSDAYELCDDDDMAIVIDDSTSVDEIWEEKGSFEENPVLQFLDNFADEFDGVGLNVGVVTFADAENSKVVVPKTSDAEAYRAQIREIRHYGGLSAFSKGIDLAIEMLGCTEGSEGCADKHIVVVTDGAMGAADRRAASKALGAFKDSGGRIAFIAIKPKKTNLMRLARYATSHVLVKGEKPQPDIIELADIEELDESTETIGMFLCDEIREKHAGGVGPKFDDVEEEDFGEHTNEDDIKIDPVIEQALEDTVEKQDQSDHLNRPDSPHVQEEEDVTPVILDVDCVVSDWFAPHEGACMDVEVGKVATCGWGRVNYERKITTPPAGAGRHCPTDLAKTEVCYVKSPGACQRQYDWWKTQGLGSPPKCDEYYYDPCMAKKDTDGCRWTAYYGWYPGSTCYDPKTEEPSSVWGKTPRTDKDHTPHKLLVPKVADKLACSELTGGNAEHMCVAHPRCMLKNGGCHLNTEYMNLVSFERNCWKPMPGDPDRHVISDAGLEAILRDYMADGMISQEEVNQARVEGIDICDKINVLWWYATLGEKGAMGKARMWMYSGTTYIAKAFGSRWTGNEVITSGYSSLVQNNATKSDGLERAFKDHILKDIKPHRN